MASAITIYEPTERVRYFRDRDGAWATTKTNDEIVQVSLDWTDGLATGETVSSVAYTASGPTTSGAALVSPVSTVTVTGTGDLEIAATLSTGRKLERTVRFYEPAGAPGSRESDYDRD